jgi:hypothetical protein
MSSVSKIINKDLQLKIMFKPIIHLLLSKHISKKETNSGTLPEKHIAAKKWKFFTRDTLCVMGIFK